MKPYILVKFYILAYINIKPYLSRDVKASPSKKKKKKAPPSKNKNILFSYLNALSFPNLIGLLEQNTSTL